MANEQAPRPKKACELHELIYLMLRALSIVLFEFPIIKLSEKKEVLSSSTFVF